MIRHLINSKSRMSKAIRACLWLPEAQHQTSHLCCVKGSPNMLPNNCLEAVTLAFQVREGDGELARLGRSLPCQAMSLIPPNPRGHSKARWHASVILPNIAEAETRAWVCWTASLAYLGSSRRVRFSQKQKRGARCRGGGGCPLAHIQACFCASTNMHKHTHTEGRTGCRNSQEHTKSRVSDFKSKLKKTKYVNINRVLGCVSIPYCGN